MVDSHLSYASTNAYKFEFYSLSLKCTWVGGLRRCGGGFPFASMCDLIYTLKLRIGLRYVRKWSRVKQTNKRKRDEEWAGKEELLQNAD